MRSLHCLTGLLVVAVYLSSPTRLLSWEQENRLLFANKPGIESILGDESIEVWYHRQQTKKRSPDFKESDSSKTNSQIRLTKLQKALDCCEKKDGYQAAQYLVSASFFGDDQKDILHYAQGRLNERQGKYEDAISQYTQSIKAYDFVTSTVDQHLPYWRRALVYSKLESFNEALADLNRVIKLRSNFQEAYVVRCYTHCQLNRLNDALSDFKKVDSANRNTKTVIHVMLGRATSKEGDYYSAADHYARAIHCSSETSKSILPLIFHEHALMRMLCDDFNEAYSILATANEVDPEFIHNHKLRVFLYLSLGAHEQAKQELVYILKKRRPSFPSYLYLYAYVLWELRDYDTAILVSEKAAKVVAGEPDVLCVDLLLAEILSTSPEADSRDGKRALELSRAACENTEWKNLAAVQAYAAASAEVGNYVEAIVWQQEIVSTLENTEQDKEFPPVTRFLSLTPALAVDLKNRRFKARVWIDIHEAKQRLECYKQHRPYRVGALEDQP